MKELLNFKSKQYAYAMANDFSEALIRNMRKDFHDFKSIWCDEYKTIQTLAVM